MLALNQIHNLDWIEGLQQLPDNSVDCCVTSPPYWALRNYGVAGQLGLEDTPEKYVEMMILGFAELWRVLKPTGSLWLNLGDSYSASKMTPHAGQRAGRDQTAMSGQVRKPTGGLKPKDLVGIPWMVAFALRNWGWYLRQDIIWNKPNPMPESITDRCTKSHEYIFLLTKSARYYYDAPAIRTELKDASILRLQQDTAAQKGSGRVPGKTNGPMKAVMSRNPRPGIDAKGGNQASPGGFPPVRKDELYPGGPGHPLNGNGRSGYFRADGSLIGGGTANKKSVWNITTTPFKEAHFATFPEEIPNLCIKAGSSEYGCCSACGAPWERSYNKTLVPTAKASYNTKADARDQVADANDQASNRTKDGHQPGWPIRVDDLGWFPTCTCGAAVVPSVVIDPFMGAGTTALVASKLGRNFIGFELNPQYIAIAEKRLSNHLGLFAPANNNT